ncbi:hypothetical protein N798_07630 [Knoellia flava TL1]|uniref:Uncharacterized protein n=1 Tax=Knoellia flava TL1 TaxID=1385518 RepID=A0ABR4XFB9_9MICO|nr:hypothetical protein N798_07630 [Knoellia flava TL1]
MATPCEADPGRDTHQSDHGLDNLGETARGPGQRDDADKEEHYDARRHHPEQRSTAGGVERLETPPEVAQRHRRRGERDPDKIGAVQRVPLGQPHGECRHHDDHTTQREALREVTRGSGVGQHGQGQHDHGERGEVLVPRSRRGDDQDAGEAEEHARHGRAGADAEPQPRHDEQDSGDGPAEIPGTAGHRDRSPCSRASRTAPVRSATPSFA